MSIANNVRRNFEVLPLLARGPSLLRRQYHVRRRLRKEEMCASIGGLL